MADISVLSRLVNAVPRNVDLSTNALVVDNIKIKLGGSFYATFSGSLTGARTITMPDANVNLGHIANLNTLSGVSAGDVDLGTFTGSTISDSTTIKNALQELETAIESAASTTEFLDSAFRIKDQSDSTKKIAFEASSISGFATRTITMPDADVDLGQVNTAILQDGTRSMAAALNMGTFRITNLGSPTSGSDAVTKSWVESYTTGQFNFLEDVDATVADATTTAPDDGLPSAVAGQRYILETNTSSLHANWGTITGVGDGDIVQYDGTAWLVAMDASSASAEGNLAWDKNLNVFKRYLSTWSEFGGLSGITTGAGLDKLGNTVFVDLATDPALEFDALGDAGKLRVKADESTIERHSGGLRIKAGGVSSNELGLASVLFSKLSADVITGATEETGADDADSILIYDNSTSLLKKMTRANFLSGYEIDGLVKPFVAGESFAADTTFLVRVAINGETLGRVYKADKAAGAEGSENHKYYVMGVMMSTSLVSAGDPILVRMIGEHTLGSSDASFLAADIGKPVFLTASGAFSLTAPSSTNEAVVRVGQVVATNKILIHSIQLVGIQA
jgi:hypothetical protein